MQFNRAERTQINRRANSSRRFNGRAGQKARAAGCTGAIDCDWLITCSCQPRDELLWQRASGPQNSIECIPERERKQGTQRLLWRCFDVVWSYFTVPSKINAQKFEIWSPVAARSLLGFGTKVNAFSAKVERLEEFCRKVIHCCNAKAWCEAQTWSSGRFQFRFRKVASKFLCNAGSIVFRVLYSSSTPFLSPSAT